MLNKQIIKPALIAAAVMASSNSMSASNFYVGTGLGYNMFSTSTPSKLDGIDINVPVKKCDYGLGALVGYQLNDWLAVEGQYNYYTINSKSSVTAAQARTDIYSKNKLHSVGLAAVGSYHVSSDFKLLGSVGLDVVFGSLFSHETNESLNATATEKSNFSKVYPNLGLGASYNLNSSLALRAMVNYIPTNLKNKDDEGDVYYKIKSITALKLSLIYNF